MSDHPQCLQTEELKQPLMFASGQTPHPHAATGGKGAHTHPQEVACGEHSYPAVLGLSAVVRKSAS